MSKKKAKQLNFRIPMEAFEMLMELSKLDEFKSSPTNNHYNKSSCITKMITATYAEKLGDNEVK